MAPAKPVSAICVPPIAARGASGNHEVPEARSRRRARRNLTINAPLTRLADAAKMVVRTRFRSIVTAIGLYFLAGLLVAYFGMHAYSGNHGLKAKEDLAVQMSELKGELDSLRAERGEWERRVSLLRPESVDPDMVDERARAMLEYVHPRDLILLRPQPQAAAGALAAAR
jgi:cell division protein FtsB